MSKDRLLNDEELKKECLTIIALQEYGTTPSNLSGEQLAKIGFASVDLYQFINTQKRLYSESELKKAARELTYHFYPFGNEEKSPEAEAAIKVIEEFAAEQGGD